MCHELHHHCVVSHASLALFFTRTLFHYVIAFFSLSSFSLSFSFVPAIDSLTMYNVQLQHPPFSPQQQHQQQQQHPQTHASQQNQQSQSQVQHRQQADVNAVAAAAVMGSDQKAFPSPLTSSSLDSPPHPHQKMLLQQQQQQLPMSTNAPASPKPYPSSASRSYTLQQSQPPYNTPTPSFTQPAVSMPGSSSSQEKDMYYASQDHKQWSTQSSSGQAPSSDYGNKQSDTSMVSPTSTSSFDEEMQQRK